MSAVREGGGNGISETGDRPPCGGGNGISEGADANASANVRAHRTTPRPVFFIVFLPSFDTKIRRCFAG